MKTLRVALFALILISFSTGFFGLGGRGMITGTVKDEDNNLVEGAIITTDKTEASETTMYSTKTGNDGTYTLESLPDGVYTITATKGLFTVSTDSITIAIPSFFACESDAVTAPDIQFGTAQKTIITETFESYSSFEDGEGGWFYVVDVGASLSIASGVGALSTNKSLLLQASNFDGIDVIKAFDTESVNSIDIEGYVMTDSSTTRFYFGCESPDYGGVRVWNLDSLLIIGHGADCATSVITGIIPLEEDTWYKIKININIVSGTWKVWINDDQDVTSGTYTDSTMPSILQLLVRTDVADPMQKTYFDEISVTCYASDSSKTFRIKSLDNLRNNSLIDVSQSTNNMK